MLGREIEPAIRSKRREMLTNGVILRHDNTRMHTAAATFETIRKLKFELPPTQHTIQISPHLITKFLDLSKMCYVDADL
jgi:hypothetical protein